MRFAAAVAMTVALVLAGCSHSPRTLLAPHGSPPSVKLAGWPGPVAAGDTRLYELRWDGTSASSTIDHYLFTEDVRALASASGWTRTERSTRMLSLRRALPLRDGGAASAAPLRLFAVRAVDDAGRVSEPAVRAFFGDNVAPEVQLTSPAPSPYSVVLVPPRVRIAWTGHDPDGANPDRLTKYKFALIPRSDPMFECWLADPDSLRRTFAPGFTTWDSLPGDSTATTLADLVPEQEFLFVVVGFDEAGAYSPVFSRANNMLLMSVQPYGSAGPRFTIHGEGAWIAFAEGGIDDAAFTATIRAPALWPVRLGWSSQPLAGSTIAGYRWAIGTRAESDHEDGVPGSPGPRRDPPLPGFGPWSRWSLAETTTVVPAAQPGASGRAVAIEAMDSNGFLSRAIVRIELVAAHRDRELLVVNDTRRQRERVLPNGTISLSGRFPLAAELDSFLFARGGVPMQHYPLPVNSVPGLLAGYDYDVLRTTTLGADRTVPLELLLRYRNVLWVTDANVLANGSPYFAPGGEYALAYMCTPGRQNTLDAYSRAGGRLWLAGGGAGFAMTAFSHDLRINDPPGGGQLFLHRSGELVSGMGLHDIAHWQTGMFFRASAHLPTRVAGSPDASHFPAALHARSIWHDPAPPGREGEGELWWGSWFVHHEYLVPDELPPSWSGTRAFAEASDDAGATHRVPPGTLDTLFAAPCVDLGPAASRPIMTVYRGPERGMVVFTGFDLWSWRPRQCQALIDGVLRGLWDLRMTSEAHGEVVASAAGHGTGRAIAPITPRRVRR